MYNLPAKFKGKARKVRWRMPDTRKSEKEKQENSGENEETSDSRVISAFHKSVEEGKDRLERSWSNLFATGMVGGIDVSIGVLALLIIEEATGSRLLGALGFSIGFIALTVARSELFEENFLVPIAAVVARKSKIRALIRLWSATAVMNLIGGGIFAWLIVNAFSELHETAIETTQVYMDMNLAESFSRGVIAGIVITLMTWMQQSSETEFGKIVAVVSAAFLLAAVPMNHVIIMSIEIFVGLLSGAPFGLGDWARVAAFATATNMIGGLLFVTFFRLVQVGGEEIKEEQKHPQEAPHRNKSGRKKEKSRLG